MVRSVAVVLIAALTIAAPVAAQSSGAVLPFLGSAPETGAQFGVAYLRVRQPEDSLGTRPSSLMGNLVFSEKRQVRTFIESDRWTAGNERRRQWGITAMSFPLAFYGPTVRSESDTPQRIDNDVVEVWFNRSRRLREHVWGSLGARVIANLSPGGVESGSDVIICDPFATPPDCPLADPALRRPFAHSTLMLTAGRAYDSRDLLFAPTRGRLTDVTLSVAYDAHGEEPFARLRLDARRFRSTGRSVLAAQLLVQGTEGRAPLDQVVVMGSNTFLRGYELGRHRDAWMAGAQAEWRRPTSLLRERLVLAAFAGGAVMASKVGDLPSGRFFPSVGGGVRYRLNPRTGAAVRVDYGVGSAGNAGLYVAFNEAF